MPVRARCNTAAQFHRLAASAIALLLLLLPLPPPPPLAACHVRSTL